MGCPSVRGMQIILIPGFWLDASAWSDVVPALEEAGHRVHPLTLPGMASVQADRTGIGLRDHVDAVIAAVDATQPADQPVVLAGHSGGGAVAYAVADARPDRVARIVYVDSGPLAPGDAINDQLPEVDGEVPLPDWSLFDDESLVDLDDGLRAAFRARAVPTPVNVTRDAQQLSDERRYDVPTTVICCEMSSDTIKELIEKEHPYVRELARVRQVDYIDLPTGHWPMFTKPKELGQALVRAVSDG